jgi:hypothetical protein
VLPDAWGAFTMTTGLENFFPELKKIITCEICFKYVKFKHFLDLEGNENQWFDLTAEDTWETSCCHQLVCNQCKMDYRETFCQLCFTERKKIFKEAVNSLEFRLAKAAHLVREATVII